MKDHDMTTEIDIIKDVQDAFGAAKRGLREIQKMNDDSGNLGAANAAMGLRGELIALHSRATLALNEFYPDHASDIQVRGGGRRGG